MSVVYHTDRRSGTTYAFESTPRYDPERKQSRPIKRYLGRVDPITHEIIPTSGRRGRLKKSEDPIHEPEMMNRDYKERYELVKADAEKARMCLEQANARNKKLESQLKRVQELLKQFTDKMELVLQTDD